MLKVVLMLALGLACSSAMAAWTKVTDDAYQTTYVHVGSIKRIGYTVKMWNKYTYKTPMKTIGGLKYLSTKGQQEYDCVDKKLRILALSAHSKRNGSGTIIFHNYSMKTDWYAITPGTVDDILWNVACGQH
jgi:hypothetical protein